MPGKGEQSGGAVSRAGAAAALCTRIDLKVPGLEALFHAHDPSPHGERDLDPGLESTLLARARENGGKAPFRIVMHVPRPDAASAAADALPSAVRTGFARRAAALEAELAGQMATGWRYLAMGMGLLTVAMVLGWALKTYALPEPLGSFVEQGLSVFGWVANWRPVEILLYERLTLRRRIALCRALAAAEVEVAR